MTDVNEFNGQVLSDLRRQTQVSLGQIARSTKISEERLNAFEAGTGEPDTTSLRLLADYFSIDEFNFFRANTPKLERFASFRTAESIGVDNFQAVTEALTLAKSFSKLLNSSVHTMSKWKMNVDELRAALKNGAEMAGGRVRGLLGIDDNAQLSSISADKFFTYVRHSIEQVGVSIVVQSFHEHRMKGIAYGADTNVPLILINSYKQSKSSRTFTLAHELCHIIREEDGVSNPYASENQVEKYCNSFAAAFLMPRKLVNTAIENIGPKNITINGSAIKALSRKLKTSQESIVIRLEELGILGKGSWSDWKRQFTVEGFLPSEIAKKGGGGTADQGITKLAYYGFLFGELIPNFIKDRTISETAVFKATRLKPKYISELERASQEKKIEVLSYGATQ